MNNLANYKVLDNKEVIVIDLEELLNFQENHDHLPLFVNNKEKMIKWFNNHLCEMLIEAYEHGEAWLEGIV